MSTDLSIRGADGLREVGRRVRAMGTDRFIVNQMVKEIQRAVPPIRRAIREHELAVLPKRGGLNVWVAAGSIRANVRRGETSAGITIIQGRNSHRKRTDMKAIDAGGTRHPFFGNRKKWYFQLLPPSAFTDGVTGEGVDEFRQAVVRAVDNAVAKYF